MAKKEGPKGPKLVARKKEREEALKRGHLAKKMAAAHHESCRREAAREEKYHLPNLLSPPVGAEVELDAPETLAEAEELGGEGG